MAQLNQNVAVIILYDNQIFSQTVGKNLYMKVNFYKSEKERFRVFRNL